MWTIIQSGLLYDWILNSTLTNVVAANPGIQFDYIGLFQERALGNRWLGEKTKPSQILLDERRRHLSLAANLRVRMLGIWNTQLYPMPHDFKGRRYNFQNDVHQLDVLLRATTFVSHESAYVLRVREDVGWYAPFIIPKAPVQITFKNCFEFKGVNDKMWYGPREAVLMMHTTYWNTFMHSRAANTEAALKLTIRNFSTTRTDIGASDARVKEDGSLCWKQMYACGRNVPQEMFCTP